jgi:pimeloyl-ACP methyl ester carboxylesterase
MRIDVDGSPVQVATGGVIPTGVRPSVVLVHGAGMDRSVWQLQTRFLAHQGFDAYAVDLPGHGLSGGQLIPDLTSMVGWLASTIEALAIAPAHVVGHSMGSLMALELAAQRPDLVASAVLLGSAPAMPVHPTLIEAAERNELLAPQLMTAWGFGTRSHVAGNPTPGMWMVGGGQALLERAHDGVIANDLKACNAYQAPDDLASRVQCKVTVLVGSDDRMTPPKAGAAVVAALNSAGVDVTTVPLAGVGHTMMSEAPDQVREALMSALTV